MRSQNLSETKNGSPNFFFFFNVCSIIYLSRRDHIKKKMKTNQLPTQLLNTMHKLQCSPKKKLQCPKKNSREISLRRASSFSWKTGRNSPNRLHPQSISTTKLFEIQKKGKFSIWNSRPLRFAFSLLTWDFWLGFELAIYGFLGSVAWWRWCWNSNVRLEDDVVIGESDLEWVLVVLWSGFSG